MIFSEKLQVIRRSRGLTQEDLAEKLQVSRQAVAKWESGMSYPDILNLIQLSNLFHITIDSLVKENECGKQIERSQKTDWDELIAFRLEAAQNTYAGLGEECNASRPASHDFSYQNGDYLYYDTYLGGEVFSGEEAIWKALKPVYSMNYFGRILSENFSSDFFKEALRAASVDCPYRGPSIYRAGDYIYQSKVSGDPHWFQGFEEVYYKDCKVYECFFHGGML